MLWWVVGALVVLPLLVVLVTAGRLRSRQLRLTRLVAEVRGRQQQHLERLQPRVERLQAGRTALERDALSLRHRIARLSARRREIARPSR